MVFWLVAGILGVGVELVCWAGGGFMGGDSGLGVRVEVYVIL